MKNSISNGTGCPRCALWKGGSVVIGTSTNQILMLDVPSEPSGESKITPLFSTHQARIDAMAVHPKKNWYLTIGKEKIIYLWDAISSCLIGCCVLDDQATCAAFHPNGTMVSVGLLHGDICVMQIDLEKSTSQHLWHVLYRKSLSNLKCAPHLFAVKNSIRSISSQIIKYSPCSTYLVVAHHDILLILDVIREYELIARCVGHSSTIVAFDFTACGSVVRNNGSFVEQFAMIIFVDSVQ